MHVDWSVSLELWLPRVLLVAGAGLGSWYAVGRLVGHLTRRGILDTPNERTLHVGAVPRGGGIAIVIALVVGCCLVALLSGHVFFFLALAAAMVGWGTLGWYDDQHDLSPRLRLFVQSLIAALTMAAFGWVTSFEGLYIGWLGAVATFLGLLWMTNLYNFMDGIDGLAASQSIVASITLAFWFYMAGSIDLATVSLLIAASSYGFLWWNWQPARIFMGDVGSITLGALFASLMIIAANRMGFSILSLILIFAVFIGDATTTLILRAARGEKIWLPHRSHYYQRLANIGVSHAKITCGAIVMMLLCSLIATLSVLYRDMIVFAVLSIVILIVAAMRFVVGLERRAQEQQ